MKAVVAAFNQEKALVGAFSVITNLRMQLFEALEDSVAELRWIGLKWTHFTFLATADTPRILHSVAGQGGGSPQTRAAAKHCPFLTTIGQEMYHLERGSKEYQCN